MKNENKIIQNPADYDYTKASSAQYCTGLIPAGITCEEEIESYDVLTQEDMYDIYDSIVKGNLDKDNLFIADKYFYMANEILINFV